MNTAIGHPEKNLIFCDSSAAIIVHLNRQAIISGAIKLVELINFLNTPYEKQFATLNWRNSKHVAEFFQIKHIDEETHQNWLEQLKVSNPKSIAFFIRANGIDVGVTYFHSIDYEKLRADWGIYIYAENMREVV